MNAEQRQAVLEHMKKFDFKPMIDKDTLAPFYFEFTSEEIVKARL